MAPWIVETYHLVCSNQQHDKLLPIVVVVAVVSSSPFSLLLVVVEVVVSPIAGCGWFGSFSSLY